MSFRGVTLLNKYNMFVGGFRHTAAPPVQPSRVVFVSFGVAIATAIVVSVARGGGPIIGIYSGAR